MTILKIMLITVSVAFIMFGYEIAPREYLIDCIVKNSYIDCILFLSLILSHFIWDYYFLPIDIVIALSGVHLLSNFFEKVRSKQ